MLTGILPKAKRKLGIASDLLAKMGGSIAGIEQVGELVCLARQPIAQLDDGTSAGFQLASVGDLDIRERCSAELELPIHIPRQPFRWRGL